MHRRRLGVGDGTGRRAARPDDATERACGTFTFSPGDPGIGYSLRIITIFLASDPLFGGAGAVLRVVVIAACECAGRVVLCLSHWRPQGDRPHAQPCRRRAGVGRVLFGAVSAQLTECGGWDVGMQLSMCCARCYLGDQVARMVSSSPAP